MAKAGDKACDGVSEPPDLRELVLRFRHVAEHPAIGNPFRSPEWRALCAATNDPEPSA